MMLTAMSTSSSLVLSAGMIRTHWPYVPHESRISLRSRAPARPSVRRGPRSHFFRGAVPGEPVAHAQAGGRVFELRIKGDLPAFLDVLRSVGMECHSTDEDVMRVFVPAGLALSESRRGESTSGDQRAIFELAARHNVQVRHLRPSIPTLEDVFAKAVGES
jgi:hypothetical protein